ncbi:MAG: non-heme iron oxygenase ferredoxin subunit [Chloroflexota bacterium]
MIADNLKTESWVRVACVAEIPEGNCTCTAFEGTSIAVFNAGGVFYAIGDSCTHAAASLSEGDFYEDIRGWVVECPRHGSQFDVTTGEAISLPATGNSGAYETKVEEGVVYINLEPMTPRQE